VVDFGLEREGWWFEGILFREHDLDMELSALS
jgi:hypothetical protein